MPHQSLHILLVEDDEIDVELTLRCLRQQQAERAIIVAPTAPVALQILRGQAGLPRLPRPYLILLDLSLPGMNGFEFLHALRQDPDLKRSPVFVLTHSNHERDQVAAYELGVAGYLLKSSLAANGTQLPTLLAVYQRLVVLPSGLPWLLLGLPLISPLSLHSVRAATFNL